MVKGLILSLVLGMLPVGATPVFWTITGSFSDGGTVSGQFTFDADTTTFSGININGSGGTNAAFNYLAVAPFFSATASNLWLVPDAGAANFTGVNVLILSFNTALTNAGGIVSLNLGGASGEDTCTSNACFGNNTAVRDVSSGSVSGASVSPTPEPFSFGLTGLGLAGLAVLRNRYRRS